MKIMSEQESHVKLIVADQEAAALTRCLQTEKEEIERKIERERQEAALLKRQH